ncbi:ABC transporter ATP-binding protein [Candidatus Bathyarchaeota archaeon B24-2]|nr:MAG: ABC transporter ATP-binding protein [Candidatus Bathyarchaeota archaeon B24-2]
MLKIENLNAGYKDIQVLFDISLNVGEEEICVLVGPNGSGKSTLLKTVMGLTQIYSGEIRFNGEAITGLPTHKITKLGIAYLPQIDNVFSNLKVRENLWMAGYILEERTLKERVEEVLEDFPILKDYLNRRAGTLSGGERQMLAMAMAMMRRPKIMLFDEPTGNLAPKIAVQVLNKIAELREKYGITIILAEQNAKKALELGDRAILLVSGRVKFEGKSRDLLSHPELGKIYLGIKGL